MSISPDSECIVCHGAGYFDTHTHDHATSITTTALCINCHTGDVITAVHGINGCANCHSTTDGSRIVGLNGNGDATVNAGAGGTCQECHATYFGGHTKDHALLVAANTLTTPAINNCVSCHDQADRVNGIHVTNGCATCHDTATNGALIASAVSGGGECVTCHTTYFNAHTHGITGTGLDHTVLQGAGDLGQIDSQPCSNCHSVMSWTNILTTHVRKLP